MKQKEGAVVGQSVTEWTENWRVLGSSPCTNKNLEGNLVVDTSFYWNQNLQFYQKMGRLGLKKIMS